MARSFRCFDHAENGRCAKSAQEEISFLSYRIELIDQVGTQGNGTCGPTAYEDDCNTAPKGSFPGMKTLEACVDRLKG